MDNDQPDYHDEDIVAVETRAVVGADSPFNDEKHSNSKEKPLSPDLSVELSFPEINTGDAT